MTRFHSIRFNGIWEYLSQKFHRKVGINGFAGRREKKHPVSISNIGPVRMVMVHGGHILSVDGLFSSEIVARTRFEEEKMMVRH